MRFRKSVINLFILAVTNISTSLVLASINKEEKEKIEKSLAPFQSKTIPEIDKGDQPLYPLPQDKLNSEDFTHLKRIWSELSKVDFNLLTGLNPRFEVLTPNELDDLKILSVVGNPNWKDSIALRKQMKLATGRLYVFTENISAKWMALAAESRFKQSIGKPLEQIIGGIQLGVFKQEPEELIQLIPILQKMMFNLVQYCRRLPGITLDPIYGVIPLGGDEGPLLGYVNDYIPVAFENIPDYEAQRLPYKFFPGSGQGLWLSKGGKVIADTGLIIDRNKLFNIDLFSNIFIYLGMDSKYPFTMSPYEFIDQSLIKAEKFSFEDLIKEFIGEDYPSQGKVEFIPLPVTEKDKDLVELLFLEDLKLAAERQNNEAIQMIAYIEKETGKKLEHLIQTFSEEQLNIIEEQERISKDVAEGRIEGHLVKQKKHKKKQSRNALKDQKVKSATLKESQLKTKVVLERFEELRKGARIKYKKMQKMLNRILKHSIGQDFIETKKGGSHKTIHGEGGAVTTVKPHGKKDTTVSSTSTIRFYERLTTLINLKT